MSGEERLPEPGSTWVMLANTDAPIPVRVIRCASESGQEYVEFEQLLPDGNDRSTSSIDLSVWQDMIANGQAKYYRALP